MLPPNDYMAFKDYELNRLPPILAKARQHGLLSEAGLTRRPWFSRLVCGSLARLGRMLVTAGRWLERHYAPPALAPR